MPRAYDLQAPPSDRLGQPLLSTTEHLYSVFQYPREPPYAKYALSDVRLNLFPQRVKMARVVRKATRFADCEAASIPLGDETRLDQHRTVKSRAKCPPRIRGPQRLTACRSTVVFRQHSEPLEPHHIYERAADPRKPVGDQQNASDHHQCSPRPLQRGSEPV